MSGAIAYHSGLAAESAVERLYRQTGHSIVARRWRGGGGEIDLIVRGAEELVFVEVKKSRSFAQAAAGLSRRQMTRIYASASEFLAGEPAGQNSAARFDVALVDRVGQIQILENAFGH